MRGLTKAEHEALTWAATDTITTEDCYPNELASLVELGLVAMRTILHDGREMLEVKFNRAWPLGAPRVRY